MKLPVPKHLLRPPATAALMLAIGVLAVSVPTGGAELAIVETMELDFGGVIDQDGSVTVGLSDDVIFDPFGIHIGNAVTTGVFSITGDPFATFSLSVTGSTVGGLSIGTFDTSQGTPPLLNVALGATGQLDLSLGAAVTVNSATAAPGNDQPLLFTITVNYN